KPAVNPSFSTIDTGSAFFFFSSCLMVFYPLLIKKNEPADSYHGILFYARARNKYQGPGRSSFIIFRPPRQNE
ncbi:MAG TPA: hypothetical protein VGZ71_07815, partial [Puia sp.]|nr:hypothetical protein [Puia sp.]